MTYIEVLVAVLLLSVAIGGVLASWQVAVRAPADKRVTEMGVYCAVSDIERLKAIKYSALVDTGGTSNVVWYDKSGTYLGSAQGATGFYKVKETISTIVPTTSTGTTRDLREIYVEVWNADETIRFEAARTMITFGG